MQPSELAGTDVRLRIFGPANEMQFAGHPVIGSTFALADDGVAAGRANRQVNNHPIESLSLSRR